jgi:hypothetical protein
MSAVAMNVGNARASEKEVKVECTAEIMMRLQKSHVVVTAATALHTQTKRTEYT